MNPEQVCRDMGFLNPFLRAMAVAAMADLSVGMPHLAVFETWRPASRQAYLYTKGRTSPGPMVTKAKPWQSWHQYGLALDFALRIEGKWSWALDTGMLRTWMVRHGLEPGPAFEAGHFQMTGGLSIADAQAIHKVDGILGVWARVAALKGIAA